MADILAEALRLYRAGWNVLPAALNGQRQPAMQTWRQFKVCRATEVEVGAWFRHPRGLGVVGGGISGGAELLDFDDHGGGGCVFRDWAAKVPRDLLCRLVLYRTPRQGWRAVYRCAAYLDGNKTVLAKRNKKDVLIELLANQFSVVPGGDVRCHETRKPYTYDQGDLAAVPLISVDEREILVETARSFNLYTPPPAPPKKGGTMVKSDWQAWGDFDQRGKWEDVLVGWTIVGHRNRATDWCRPGKDSGISATTNYHGNDLLHVFTSSTELAPDKSYTKSAAFAFLHCKGDFSLANKELARKGYGRVNESMEELEKRLAAIYGY